MTKMTDLDRLIDDLAADSAPVTAHSTSAGRVGLALVFLATLAVGALVFGLSVSTASLTATPVPALAAGLMLVLAVAAGLGALRMARPQVGAASSPAPWLFAALLVLPLVALVQIWLQPAMAAGLATGPGLRCLSVGLVLGLGTAAFLTMWLRKGAPVSPDRAAWMVGLASGSVGAFAVGLECPSDLLAHIGVWHVAAVPLAGLAARFALPPLLRW